jgi:TDG/mug DNA glycosylase family protein
VSPRAQRPARAPALPDYVRPGLRLLICGLNPSPFAARTGVPFGRPGNRFWAAALRAGLVERDRDPRDALRLGIGFTDLCKRTAPRAGEISREEYAQGLVRLRRKLRAWRPRAVCLVGLEGWRRAVDRRAAPGWVPGGIDGCPAYLMPSTSGLNARVDLAALARHLRRAGQPPDTETRRVPGGPGQADARRARKR